MCSDSGSKLIQLSITWGNGCISTVPPLLYCRLSIHMHFLTIRMYFSMSEVSGFWPVTIECTDTPPLLWHHIDFILVMNVGRTELTTDRCFVFNSFVFAHICTYDRDMKTFLFEPCCIFIFNRTWRPLVFSVHAFIQNCLYLFYFSFAENVKIKHIKTRPGDRAV